MSSRSSVPSPIAIVAILTDRDTVIDPTLEAVASQSYEPAAIFAVGPDCAAQATAVGIPWAESVQTLLNDLPATVTHVWLLQAGAVPQMTALYALLFEADRVEAAMAGSKLIDLNQPERLVSVGTATDVFDVPYQGLDEDEMDAGQYDVVRDVAAVVGVSIVARRDLLKGIGGPDPSMAPGAAAIDLSQRARARGARVVVVPSSVVAVPGPIEGRRWREEAGRIRAMVKVYSGLTLLWALPTRFLVGLVEAIAAPFAGRWTLFDWVRSWVAAAGRLPSTVAARRRVMSREVVGDAELFRYQIKGSAALRALGADLVEAARARFPSDDRSGVLSLAEEMRRPAVGLGLGAALFAYIATRELWAGFPGGGLSLPLPDTGAAAYGAYAGGWNPAGFGSTEQLPPFLGVAGLIQQLLFDRGDLAAGALGLLAFVGGIWGTTRLLRTWSVDSVPGILAGVVFMAGPAARTIAGSGDVPNLIALGLVPWVMRIAVAPWPRSWWGRVGRIAAAGWVTALAANLSPDLWLLPAGALALRAVVALRGEWRPVLVAAAGAVVSVPLLRPWLGGVDVVTYLRAGEAFWEPGTGLLIAALVVAVAAIAAAPDGLWRLAVWGALVGAIGGFLSRTASQGGGRHLEALGLAAVALGTAVVVAAGFDAVRHAARVDSLRRLGIGFGAVAGGVLVVSTLLVVGPGRGGLPADELGAALRFTSTSTETAPATRVLLIGPPESLPGTSRRVLGAAYRVIAAPQPRLWDVELPEAGPADAELEELIGDVIAGETFRAGSRLADFGIHWILAMGETPLTATFVGQLDLVPLDGLRRPAFLVDSDRAVRAITADGAAWRSAGTGYVGEPAPQVTVREHADPGWGADAESGDWAMTLDGSAGTVGFTPAAGRRQGAVSLWSGAGLAVLSAVARRRRR